MGTMGWFEGVPENRRVYALRLVGLAAVYYGAAKLGLSLAFMNSSISAVWPPTGIALTALVFWGYRMWPAIALGALAANSFTGIPISPTAASLQSAEVAPRVLLSMAGHPLPLVVRAGGTVEPLGGAGTLLGAVSNPMLSDYSAELDRGDAVLLYTDGLTDAYAPERIVSQEDLVATLGRYAGRAAAAIASGVQSVVLNGRAGGDRAPRDDITILVLRVPERAGIAAVVDPQWAVTET
jgi:hypothetical protein